MIRYYPSYIIILINTIINYLVIIRIPTWLRIIYRCYKLLFRYRCVNKWLEYAVYTFPYITLIDVRYFSFQTTIPTYPSAFPNQATGAAILLRRIRRMPRRSEEEDMLLIRTPRDLQPRQWTRLQLVSSSVICLVNYFIASSRMFLKSVQCIIIFIYNIYWILWLETMYSGHVFLGTSRVYEKNIQLLHTLKMYFKRIL